MDGGRKAGNAATDDQDGKISIHNEKIRKRYLGSDMLRTKR
jgi:hypothetical protein